MIGQKRNAKRFTVPRAVLLKGSPILKAECEKEWGPKETKVITLEDLDIDVFSCYLE